MRTPGRRRGPVAGRERGRPGETPPSDRADLERRHGAPDGPACPDRAGDGRRSGRDRERHLRSPRTGPPRGGALDRAARRRRDACGRPAGALGRPHAGQDLRPARDRAPAGHCRPADVDGRALGTAVVGANAPRPGPLHARPGRGDHRGHRRGPCRYRADRRRADRGDPRSCRRVGRRADDGGVPGALAALATAHEHGGTPGRAVLRTGPRPKGDLHEPTALAAGLRARGRGPRPCAGSFGVTCTPTDPRRRTTSPGGSRSRPAAPRRPSTR